MAAVYVPRSPTTGSTGSICASSPAAPPRAAGPAASAARKARPPARHHRVAPPPAGRRAPDSASGCSWLSGAVARASPPSARTAWDGAPSGRALPRMGSAWGACRSWSSGCAGPERARLPAAGRGHPCGRRAGAGGDVPPRGLLRFVAQQARERAPWRGGSPDSSSRWSRARTGAGAIPRRAEALTL